MKRIALPKDVRAGPSTSTVRVRTFAELHAIFQGLRDDPLWIFRGQSDARWKLVPKAGRGPFKQLEDDCLFADWKSDALQFISEKPATDLQWLALAQHHGLATRMLDWTRNPLVAAFFAVWEDNPVDAAIYAFHPCDVLGADFNASPFESVSKSNVYVWFPDPNHPRLARQRGVFTVHQPPSTPLKPLRRLEHLMRIVIVRIYRDTLRKELSYYGINRSSLFPDLEGVASHHNWRVTQPPVWWIDGRPPSKI
jgi:hypothetical protein